MPKGARMMKVVNITKNNLRELKKFSLGYGIFNTEADLFIMKTKEKWDIKYKMLKAFFCTEGPTFSNKLFTINELIDNRNIINIDELVLPERLLVVDDCIIGFIMPYIDSVNFEAILNDTSISNLTKIEYFKQISCILKKMDNLRKNSPITDFYLNDLHASNFILNKKTGKINVVDLDSCKINGNKPFAAKYLTPAYPISGMKAKYRLNEELQFSGYIIPDKNTDLYCYVMTLMNFLFKGRISSLGKEGYYLYLEYLRSINYPYELLDKLSKIYEYTDNEEIGEELECLTNDMIVMAQSKIFEMKTNKLGN